MAHIPFEECCVCAEAAINNGFTIHQKWTCAHCSAMQTMEQPNAMFMKGNCEECRKTTDIKLCGFMAMIGVPSAS